MHPVAEAHVVAEPTHGSEESCGCRDRIDVRPSCGFQAVSGRAPGRKVLPMGKADGYDLI